MIPTRAALITMISARWLLLLAAAASSAAVVDANMRDSQNVFGWQQKQKRRRVHPSRASAAATSSSSSARHHNPLPLSSSSSPLRRSENVFGWQTKSSRRAVTTNNNEQHDNTYERTNQRTIQQTTGSTASRSSLYNHDDYEEDDSGKHLNLSPPNIKIQPRKKELWLPWPLGSLRDDFYRFAEDQRSYGNRQQQQQQRQQQSREWHPRGSQGSQQQQQQLRNYYSDEGYRPYDGTGIFDQGRDWAGRMLRRGTSLINRRIGNGETTTSKQQQEAESSQYWIKDTTTPMATASAAMGKDKIRGGAKRKSKVLPSGEITEEDADGKHFDKDVVLKYLKLQASVRLRQLGYVGSDFSVHLPPASPIILFYYLLPSKQDPIRRLVKYTVAGAALSWMHSEATKYRRFSPLPGLKGVNVRRPNLPPFLPELTEEVSMTLGALDDGAGGGAGKASVDTKSSRKSKAASGKPKEKKSTKEEENTEGEPHHNTPSWRDPFQSFGTISSAYRNWLEGYTLRNKLIYEQRRVRAQERLLELQKESKLGSGTTNSTSMPSSTDAGYALVTGASSGIGRALAVELARYRIPLILVARDLTKLGAVAKDIETYYGVPCRILRADLNSPDCASRIHAATTSAGLNVDILVNNAGVCSHGNFLEGDLEDATQMIQVNIGAVTQLSRLYGKDMKERRRGRILFVSSMSGVLPGNPSVSVYAATKAYSKSLASSLGREMERYGVGVTCMLPGAVKDTSFASSSEVEQAACFHFPGYAKTPELVASEGVKSLMLGHPESYPGWQNRAFVKMFLPMLPPRFCTMIGEWAWNPWEWGDVLPHRPGRSQREDQMVMKQDDKTSVLTPSTTASSTGPKGIFRRSTPQPANEMQLPDVPKLKAAMKSPDLPMEPPAIEIVPPAIKDVPAEESKPKLDENKSAGLDVKPKDPSTGAPAAAAAQEQEVQKSPADVDSGAKKDDIQKVEVADEQISQSKEDEKTESKEDALSSQQVPPTTEPLVLPPATAPQQDDTKTSQPFLFGFFDKDRSPSPAASGEEPKQNSDAKDAITGRSGGAAEETSAQDSTWYPSMMDKKEYDFRDRRLDY